MFTTTTTAPALAARKEALLQNLSLELRLPQTRLRSFSRLREDLFMDGTDVELLIATLESRLDYYLTEEEIASVETLGDLQRVFIR